MGGGGHGVFTRSNTVISCTLATRFHLNVLKGVISCFHGHLLWHVKGACHDVSSSAWSKLLTMHTSVSKSLTWRRKQVLFFQNRFLIRCWKSLKYTIWNKDIDEQPDPKKSLPLNITLKKRTCLLNAVLYRNHRLHHSGEKEGTKLHRSQVKAIFHNWTTFLYKKRKEKKDKKTCRLVPKEK